jgi:hypothetical protein
VSPPVPVWPREAHGPATKYPRIPITTEAALENLAAAEPRGMAERIAQALDVKRHEFMSSEGAS